jgi:hypothetical protein
VKLARDASTLLQHRGPRSLGLHASACRGMGARDVRRRSNPRPVLQRRWSPYVPDAIDSLLHGRRRHPGHATGCSLCGRMSTGSSSNEAPT